LGILSFTSGEQDSFMARLNLRREGEYVALSAGYGPVEIAMRVRYADFTRALTHLQPVDGLAASRQVGSGEVSISLGLQTDGTLVLRPTLASDASGHINFNFELTPASAAALNKWLGV
jgi:hypothetical protein